jgi:hypothetical protein
VSRSVFAGDAPAAVAVAICINIALALYFAADTHGSATGPLPNYAIQPIDAELARSQSSADPEPLPLIRVMFRRPDTDTLANVLLGILVWLPATVSVFATGIQLVDFLNRPVTPEFTAGVKHSAVILAVALLGLAVLWSVNDNTLFGNFLLVLFLATLLAVAVWRPPVPDRGALLVTALFLVTGLAASITSHRLCSTYHGLVPVLYVDQQAQDQFLGEIQNDLTHLENITPDVVFDRIQRLPALNEWRPDANLFARNRFATKWLIVVSLIYLLIAACRFDDLRKRYELSKGFVITYAMGLYLAMGATFGLAFYNDVLSDAGRQNVLCVYARVLSASDSEYARLKQDFARFGWSGKLEKQIENVRLHARPGVGQILQAALAQHWSDSVIAQQQPQAVWDGKKLNLGESLVKNQTLADMFYFSFASFTTTGYGDLRPVSDDARFWSIVENVAELLFTAIFFVLALAPAPPEPPQSNAVSRAKAIIVGCLALLALTRCNTIERGFADPKFPSSNRYCPKVLPQGDLEVDVIIDDSRSMLGYLREPTSDYRMKVQRLVGGLQAHARPTFRPLSNPDEPVDSIEEILTEEFYNKPDTPLTAAFSFAVGHPRVAVVVISDFEQDEEAGVTQLCNAVKQVAQGRPYVAMYGLQTKYRHGDDTASRPWYALLMTTTNESLTELEKASDIQAVSYDADFERVSETRASGPYVVHGRSFVTVETLEWLSEPGTNTLWQEATDPQSFTCRGCDRFVQYSAFKKVATGASPLRFDGVLRSDIPLRDVENLSISLFREDGGGGNVPVKVDIQNLPGKHGIEIRNRVQRSVPASDSPDARPQRLPIEFVYDLPIDGTQAVYRVEFSAGRLNLACPAWVRNWSTTDPDCWRKTLNLDVIVESILDQAARDDVFFVHYLILGKTDDP